MRIAFTGSHSTGKSTLLKEISKIYEGKIYSITEVARSIIARGYPLNMDANVDSYIHYVNEQLKAEAEAKDYDLLISDRTLIDPVAYALVNRNLPRPFIPDYFIEMMESVWLLEKNLYDLYVYFPVEFEMEQDFIRPVDREYRVNVGLMTKELLDKHKINYITITGSIDERVKMIMSFIRGNEKD